MSDTTPNEASELEKLIEKRIKIASTETTSDDEVVQIAWIADGLDLWYRTKGERGHSPAQTRRYIISSVTRLLQQARVAEVERYADYLVDLDSEAAFEFGWNEYAYKRTRELDKEDV